jgi:hypothetical protein
VNCGPLTEQFNTLTHGGRIPTGDSPPNPEKNMSTFQINPLLQSKANLYSLPGSKEDVYICPVSGGADSTALAILLRLLFPGTYFHFVFTDTKAELPEIYDSLDRLEKFLQQPITRITPTKGLFELIEQDFNGFLPSYKERWCTRILKAQGFAAFLEQFKNSKAYIMVGIRSDESERLAFTMDGCETEMPFVDMGLKREDIFQILMDTIGIPSFYKFRTRSGCTTCFYQRRSELVSLREFHPIHFHAGKKYEKLSERDTVRHQVSHSLRSEVGWFWPSLPKPSKNDVINGKLKRQQSPGLFSTQLLFVAAEYFYDGMISRREFCWHQRIISFSTSLSGIKKQIDNRYQQLLVTPEAHHMSLDEVRKNTQFSIFLIEAPETIIDSAPLSSDSFTWSGKESYQQIDHILSHVERILFGHTILQEAKKDAPPIMTVQFEWYEHAISTSQLIDTASGEVISMMNYQPTESIPEVSLEEELKTLPCPMCTI